MAGRNDLVDEGGPLVRPILLQDRDKDKVQLVQKRTFVVEALFGAGELDNEVDDEVADTYLY
jgi:hypothetical protein